MKRFLIVFLSGIVGVLICIGLFYVVGQVFNPLYQGEGESTRKFKIFLGSVALFFSLGVLGGIRLTRKNYNKL